MEHIYSLVFLVYYSHLYFTKYTYANRVVTYYADVFFRSFGFMIIPGPRKIVAFAKFNYILEKRKLQGIAIFKTIKIEEGFVKPLYRSQQRTVDFLNSRFYVSIDNYRDELPWTGLSSAFFVDA